MIAHTSQFKEELFKFGRQYKNLIGIYDNLLLATQNDDILLTEDGLELIGKVATSEISYELDDTNIFSVKLITKGELLSTLMKELDFESDINLDVGSTINYKFGILVNNAYEYLDYGKYLIYKKEYQNDKKTYLYTCYDNMLRTMVQIGSELTYNTIAGASILPFICTTLGLTFDDSLYEQDGTTPTPYGMIKNLVYQIDLKPIKEAKLTYRDLLNMICQYFGVSMYMQNDELKIKLLGTIRNEGTWIIDNDIPDAVDTIDSTPFKDKNVTFQSEYGKINAINITGTDESKTIYVEDTQSVTDNGLTLFEIKNNLIINDDDIWDTYSTQIANNLLEMVDGVHFNLCDFSTYGIMYLEWLDYYDVNINGRLYTCLLLNSEITVKSGISENIYTDLPEKTASEYTTTPKSNDAIYDTIRARGNAYANGYKLVQENAIHNYSTGEQIIGDWFGSPLYRKCYIVQAGNLTYGNFATISTSSNYKIKKWSGWYYRSGEKADGFMPGGNVNYDPLIMTIRNTDIEYRIDNAYQQDGIEAVFIIEYIK